MQHRVSRSNPSESGFCTERGAFHGSTAYLSTPQSGGLVSMVLSNVLRMTMVAIAITPLFQSTTFSHISEILLCARRGAALIWIWR
jgi:hypothetical protein